MSVSKLQLRLLLLITITGLLLSGCSGFSFDNLFFWETSDEASQGMVEVTFYVQLPLNTPEGEIIYLSTLDEVTGLGVNAAAHPLEPALGETNQDQGLVYKTILKVPQNSIIKYRYTRQNQYAIIEHTQIDEQVRYRIAKVDNPLEIHDVVSKWSDTTYYWPEPGRISGTITDEVTGDPVAGLLVAGGGVQTFTTSSGKFMLPGLPPGVHNVVVYSPDGSYHVVQQGAEVASQANTEANLFVKQREYVDITFLVKVPIGTPEKSVRLVGNLYQLGNTFGSLPGGMNTDPVRMPLLGFAGGTQYGIILSLPVGAEIKYKYTLGDGFWNAEHDSGGGFPVRRLIVPDHPIQIDDEVITWKSGIKDSITFDLWTPENTPAEDEIFIQFNPYGWTTPLPMTELTPNHWIFILYSPFDIISDLTYRYCREGECGIADDEITAGVNPAGRTVVPSVESQYIADTVENWIWLEDETISPTTTQPVIQSRGGDYLTGIEIMPGRKAASTRQISSILPELSSLHANWIIYSPTWSVTHIDPPIIEPVPNQDPLWQDLNIIANEANANNLKLAYFPQPHFAESSEIWWESAPRDFSWWNSWFDQYKNFAFHFADAAEQQGIDMLILGGDWLVPALPGGKLPNGEPSGVPADSELRWQSILSEINTRFSGTIAWTTSIPAPLTMPSYLEHVDQIHLNWLPSFTETTDSSFADYVNQATLSLDDEVRKIWLSWLKSNDKLLILRLSYPSVSGWDPNCSPDPESICYGIDEFNLPAPDLQDFDIDLVKQEEIYSILLHAAEEKSWVSGIISQGFYAPTILHDKSISIHGKPTEEIIKIWFTELGK
jgi:hypothetical protein